MTKVFFAVLQNFLLKELCNLKGKVGKNKNNQKKSEKSFKNNEKSDKKNGDKDFSKKDFGKNEGKKYFEHKKN